MSKTEKELSTNLKEWRLSTVLDFISQGMNQSEISKVLQVSESTISRDLAEVRLRARDRIAKAIEEEIPTTWYKTRITLHKIEGHLNKIITDSSVSHKDKLTALNLLKDVAQTEYDIVADSTVIDQALKIVKEYGDTIPKEDS